MDREDSTRAGETPEGAEHPHGYTLADAEMERLEAKASSGDVLDPLALNDPVGKSVERVIIRVGVTVVIILIVAILLAQVACKNIRLSTIPNFNEGVSVESVERAMKNGVLYGGEVVTFPSTSDVVSLADGVLKVQMDDDTSRSIDQVAAAAQGRSLALAMNTFEDESVTSVVVETLAHANAETGAFTGKGSDPMQVVLTITWTRDASDPQSFSCTLTGYDINAQLSSSERAASMDRDA